jgi:hypothetical protein
MGLTNDTVSPYDSRYRWICRRAHGMESMPISTSAIVISIVAGLVLTGLPVGSRVR